MIKITDKKKFFTFVFFAVAIIAGISFGAYKLFTREKPVHKMSFVQAGKNGEKKVYQAMVKINKPQGEGDLERGDVVLAAPENRQWSQAEKDGFLIIKMNLTEAQSMLLVQSKADYYAEEKEVKSEADQKKKIERQGRRFAVDLEKMGILPNQERGKMISGRIFEGAEIVIEKN